MFTPPPMPSLSKAQLEAYRTQRSANEISENDAKKRRIAGASRVSRPVHKSASPELGLYGAGLIRKIAAFGKERAREPRSLAISVPLAYAAPQTALPSIPRLSPILPPPPPVPPPSRPLPLPGPVAMAPPKRPPRPTSGLLFDVPAPSHESVVREVDTTLVGSLKNKRPLSQYSRFSTTSSGSSRSSEATALSKRDKRPPRLSEDALKLQKSDSSGSRRPLRGRNSSPASKETVGDRSSMSPLATPDRIVRTSVEVRANPRDSKMEISPTFVMGASLARRIAIKTQILETTFNDASSPYRLSTMGETGKITRLSQIRSPLASPTATQIHLRGGSIVTVIPPAEDIYRRRRYIQGPIRLTKGHVILRKNSVASLDPFQSAVDKIYQDGESISKRKSEMASANEICSFFSSFALSDCRSEGSILTMEGASNSDASDEEEQDEDNIEIPDTYHDCGTPPDSPTAWRVGGQSGESTLAMMPPVQNEEMLRVKGIGWLAKQRMRQDTKRTGLEEREEEAKMEGSSGAAPWIKSVGEQSGVAMLRRNSQ